MTEQHEDPLEVQRRLELRIRDLSENNASFDELKKAHDDFHAFIIQYGARGKGHEDFIYKKDLSPIDTLFLKRIGTKKSMLEIGLGDGLFLINCAKYCNDASGIDISSIVIDRIKNAVRKESICGNLDVKLGDAKSLDFPNRHFDIVVSKDLVEHLCERDLMPHLQEVARTLKQSGVYLIWTPSSLLGHTSLGAHLKEYTLSEMLKALRKANFEPKLMNLHLYRISGIYSEISNRLLTKYILAYEKVLGYFFHALRIQVQNPAIYVIVPPVCVAAYKQPDLRLR